MDFSSFDLACISGINGAGKSSLLDAITWSLFGQARKRDESLINNHPEVKAAEVVFTFGYEGNVYRVQRTLLRGKGTQLEFQIQQPAFVENVAEWRPLTEHTVRDTQNRIEAVLRLDYETFVNAAFFLQGRADQFTQQSSSRRKEILSNILGLEAWETYKERAAEHRKASENNLEAVRSRLQEIDTELDEEPARSQRLKDLGAELGRLTAVRKTQESVLDNIRKVAASLEQQRKFVETINATLQRSQANLSLLQTRLAEKHAERLTHANLIARSAEIESVYTAWQTSRTDLEHWEGIAVQFRTYESRRLPFFDEINTEKAKLEQEKETLEGQAIDIQHQSSIIGELKTKFESAEKELEEAEALVKQHAKIDAQVQSTGEKQAALRVENINLKAEMEELKVRIDKLDAADGALCPLCGQPLSPEHRKGTLKQLKTDGRQKGDAWRANKAALEDITLKVKNLESRLSALSSAENDRLVCGVIVSQLAERLEIMERVSSDWGKTGAKRLVKVMNLLEAEDFAPATRKKLAQVDRELSALGYDAATHDAVRKTEVLARSAENEYRMLESARSALKPLDSEIANLKSQIGKLQAETSSQQAEHDNSTAALAAAESQVPDLDSAELELFALQERENQLNQEVGAARQKVMVLDDLRKRRKQLEIEKGDLGLQIGWYKALERAFGKDGVPALLIEQALPEIESKANELLDRLSDGTMSVRFVTQAEYKDKNRADLKETLDIQISDGAGVRDYEMYSGGEAFRVNFAIRLALSEVLARRKGARLQTLIIDEGFGSQDTQGRHRLIESINAVKSDFARILVITHLEDLKDAFPTRIEVEKTERGSTVRVI